MGSVNQVGVTGFDLRSLALDPATRTLYSTEYGGLLTVDMATGAGTTIGWALGAESMALDPVTGLVYMADQVVYRFDPSRGQQTFVTSFEFADDVQSLAFDPRDHLLYATFGTDVYASMANLLASIDPDTGTATVLGDIGFMDVQSLAFDPSARMLYGVDRVTSQLIAIEPDSLLSVAVGPVGFPNVRGLTLDLPTDTLYGTTVLTGSAVITNGGARGELIEIDRHTGAGTLVGLTPRRLVGLASRLPSVGWGR
jgi:hypothetical protein